MPLIDVTEALDLLEAAVNEAGADHVYDIGEDHTCRYVRGGVKRFDPANPGAYTEDDSDPSQNYCIVGHVLHQKGVSDEKLAEMGAKGLLSVLDYGNNQHYLAGTDLKFTDDAAQALRSAQMVQDRRGTWGDALTHAKTTAGIDLDS